ncbi:MAG: hypothetical protein RLZ44_424 [Pseudomonadota bacterium]|jgi:phosphoglycolate phosphatase
MAPLRHARAVLFDLDGTFADTAPDLAYALNQTLAAFGLPPLPFERIRPVVSHGGLALIRLGFGLEPEQPGFAERRQHLLDVYHANLCRETRLFDGMAEVLAALEAHGLPWGIVTNKPAWLTDPLIAAMGLRQRAGSVISGDTCAHRKPHPEPILCACRELRVAPQQTVYVGDADRDMAAGRAAGAIPVAALFGYILEDDDPAAWDADHRIGHAAELLELLGLTAARAPHV